MLHRPCERNLRQTNVSTTIKVNSVVHCEEMSLHLSRLRIEKRERTKRVAEMSPGSGC